MPKQYAPGSPYARALRWSRNASNDDLCTMVMEAARHSWPFLQWPRSIPREDVPAAVYEYVRERVQYVREDGDQLIRMPWRTLEDGQGDCKSLTVLVAALARAAGCSVVVRFVRYAGDDHYGHVYPIVDGVPVDVELPLGSEVNYQDKEDRRL